MNQQASAKAIAPSISVDVANDYQGSYKSKLTTPEIAVSRIPKKCNIMVAFFSGAAPSVLKAIGDRVRAGAYDELRLFYMHPSPAFGDALLQYDLMNIVKPHPVYVGAYERALTKRAVADGRKVVYYVPCNFSDCTRLLTEDEHPDVFVLQVSPMDRAGYFSFGTTGAYSPALTRKAEHVIVEVNPQMPRTFGQLLHVSEVHTIVEGSSPIPEIPLRPVSELDAKIGQLILELVPDRACVQFGIGGVPTAVAGMLKNHRDLGVHTELLSDGILELINAGAVTNRFKKINQYKSVFNIAMGTQALYRAMHDNPSMECWPSEYVNDPRVIGSNDNVLSVNSFLEADLNGQVNAEFLAHHQFSAPGGQLDFVRGAAYSKGGVSILAAHATSTDGRFSRIVPSLSGPATDPRMETQYIVTEYGACNLRGKSTPERALALISIAHPKFQEELLRQAKTLNLIA